MRTLSPRRHLKTIIEDFLKELINMFQEESRRNLRDGLGHDLAKREKKWLVREIKKVIESEGSKEEKSEVSSRSDSATSVPPANAGVPGEMEERENPGEAETNGHHDPLVPIPHVCSYPPFTD
jgi:hypothetical protein